jgi:hypothetical protein
MGYVFPMSAKTITQPRSKRDTEGDLFQHTRDISSRLADHLDVSWRTVGKAHGLSTLHGHDLAHNIELVLRPLRPGTKVSIVRQLAMAVC